MKNKILRVVVSLLLVCILIFNITPIRVQASALPEVAGVVTKVIPFNPGAGAAAGGAALGAQVFGWVLLGLGIIVTTAQAIELMNRYTEYSGELETSIYYYPDGSWSYGVDMGFVERVRAFAFNTGVVRYSVPIPDDISYRDLLVSYVNNFRKWYPYCLVVYCGSVWSVSASEHPLNFYQSSDGQYYNLDTDDGGSVIRFATRYADNWTSSFQWKASAVTSYCHFGSDNLNSSELVIESDYDLGVIAPLEMLMPDSYPDWHTNARPATNPDTQEEITVLPIPLNPSADPDAAPDTLTQPDIWQGTIADPMPDSDSSTDTELTVSSTPWEQFKRWISEGWNNITKAIPSAETIGQSIGNTIRELFIPSPDTIGQKVGEMRDLFPFIDGIISTGEAIRDGLSYDIAPPEIWFDLGEATTDTFGHKKYLLTDFSWYAPYKPRVDALLSAALWAFFSWRVFIRLPSIIGGEGGQIESFAVHSFEARMEKEQADDRKRRGKK